MRPIQDLAHRWRVYAAECDTEIWNAVNIFNAHGSTWTEDDLNRIVAGWREERGMARDTASYLETLAAIQARPKPHPVAQHSYTWNPWGAICVSMRRV